MTFELTPVWDAMLKEYGDPLAAESLPIEPTEHPIYDALVTSPPDPLIKEHE